MFRLKRRKEDQSNKLKVKGVKQRKIRILVKENSLGDNVLGVLMKFSFLISHDECVSCEFVFTGVVGEQDEDGSKIKHALLKTQANLPQPQTTKQTFAFYLLTPQL